jgi:FtsP/CotA-like multicopper oxidase with cupredoxin domain
LSAAPVSVERIFVTPGEREELFVAPLASPGSTATLTWKDPDRLHIGVPEPEQPLFDVQVTRDAPPSIAPVVPATLAAIEPLDVTGLVPRTITFDDVLVPEPDAGADAAIASLGINGKSSTNMADMATVTVAANSVEHWTIVNHTSQDHPFHMHGYRFQVLTTAGVAPPALEWRDTANVPAMGQLDLAAQFDSRTGMWMFHCHILDHAEIGMMAMLMVTP